MRVFFVLLLLAPISMIGQTVTRSALSSGGNYVENSGYQISSSYGQFAVLTFDNSSTLTQGFQQADRNPCFGDLDNNGIINSADLGALLNSFGCTSNCIGDLDGNGLVNAADLGALLQVFGTLCP